MNKIKSMLLMAAIGMGTNVMAQSASWTYYNPDNIYQQGWSTNSTIYVKQRTTPTLADFNNDGKLEMVYGGQNVYDWDYVYEEFEQNGEMVTDWHWKWVENWNNSAYVIGFNGLGEDPVRLDGKTDFWTFQTDIYGIPLGTCNFYRWIDFDNDGNLDLIMFAKRDYDNRGYSGDYYALIYQNEGPDAGYHFTSVDKAPFNVVDGVPGFNPNDGYWDGNSDYLGRNNRGITFGDVNNDGIMDFVCMNYGDQLSVFLGNGDGSFTKKVQLEEAYREGDVKLADLDGDGALDIVASAWNSEDRHVNFYKGNGDGTFVNATPSPVRHVRGGGVAIADFNNDGKLDVFTFGYCDIDGFWFGDIYLNQGNFTFERPMEAYYSFTHNDANWNTCLGDGGENKLWWADRVVAYAFDVDNDGNNDILFTYGTQLMWARGNGDGSFQTIGYCNNKQSSDKSAGGFSFGDIYNRNMLDQAICYKNDDNAHIATLLGRTANGELNQAPTAPTNLVAERDGNQITLTWTAGTDDVTPEQGLSYNVFVKYGNVVRTIIPAHTEGELSGRLKVVQDMQTLIHGTTCILTVPEDVTDIEVGVSTVDGVYAPSAFTTVTLSEAVPYDIDGNGESSIDDVVALIDIILGKDNGETPLYDHAIADVNNDGVLSVADVTALVNIILGTVPETEEPSEEENGEE